MTTACVRLYRDAKQHYDLFLLAEALTEYDEMFGLWRFRHVQMVERVIGGRPGRAAATAPVTCAARWAGRFFPELWEMRTRLGNESGGPASPHG